MMTGNGDGGDGAGTARTVRTVIEAVTTAGFDAFMAPLERWKLHHIRSRLIPRASGAVLEIGAGTGVNLRYYRPENITSLTLSDRDDRRATLRSRVSLLPERVGRVTSVQRLDAEVLPFPDDTFDTVVATLLFCSVDCPPCGFDEILRVLKPKGVYLFLEHVQPVRSGTARLFDTINPLWNTLSRGCNLNRDTLLDMESAGFILNPVHRDGGAGVFVWGVAHPRTQQKGEEQRGSA
jgi:SAM-dependent methyltransferase